MKNKNIKLSLLGFVFFVTITSIYFSDIRELMRKILPHNTKVVIKELFFGEDFMNRVNTLKLMNYNQKVLPETQFEKIDLKKIKLDITETGALHYHKIKNTGKKAKKFFLETSGDKIIIATFEGDIQLVENLKKFDIKKIENNLPTEDIYTILDIELVKDDLFVSLASLKNDNRDCSFFELYRSKFDSNKLEFTKIYETGTCLKNTLGGRIHGYNLKNQEGILFTTGASSTEKNLAQLDKSPNGKILFLNLKNLNVEIFSKGHRNPQGLLIEDDIILSTEHSAYGGDEINKIVYGGNYGWPIFSLGDLYLFEKKILNERKNYSLKKEVNVPGYKDPIYTFIPSIGISEIIKVPDYFSKYWKNNYLITSLNGMSIYRVRFDKEYSKIIFSEKIFIGERIRDIKFSKKLNSFILALESNGYLGILSSPQSTILN